MGLLDRLRSREHTFILSLAALVGLLGGLGSVLFRGLIQLVQRGFWGDWSYTLGLVRQHPWWWILLAPALGALIAGPLVHWLAREARGAGIPEVMEAVAIRSGFIRARLVVVKTVASALTIGSGGSVGREGPIVQIGASLASTLGQWSRVSPAQLRTLVGCGAAAGIAGTFNAPVAGALFAVEVVLGDFAVSAFSPIVISSVMATVVSRHFLGDFPAFPVPAHELVSAWELGVYAVLGLVAGMVALVFIAFVYGVGDRLESTPLPRWVLPAVGGIGVGAIAVAFPEVLGVGYEAITAALAGELGLTMVAALLVAKLVATSLAAGSGGSGGFFAPSLFLGAMTGTLIGGLAHRWFPAVTGGPGAYALVGMGALVAGTTHAPITAILIIFEMTSDYKLILPLMASCILSTVVVTRKRKASIYTEKLRRRGVEVLQGRELNVLRRVAVEDVMERDPLTVAEDRPLGQLLDLLSREPRSAYYVVGDDRELVGVIRVPDLQATLLHADALAPVIVAGDLVREQKRTLAPQERLDVVMRLFAETHTEELPVVDPAAGRLEGVITRRHLIEAYDREILKQDMASGIGARLDAARTHEVEVGQQYVMVEVDPPIRFVGRSLQELGVRSRYGVQVLLVRRPGSDGERVDLVPEGGTRVQAGDRLVVLGPKEAVAELER